MKPKVEDNSLSITDFVLPEQLDSYTRRQLLRTGASLTAYVSAATFMGAGTARATTAQAKRLVWINMSGGWDILEVTDPKMQSTAGIDMTYGWDEAQVIRGAPDNLRIGRSLSRIAGIGSDLLVVRGLGMGTTSHQAGSIYMDTGILANTGRVNVASIPSIVASQSQATIPIIQLAGGSEPLIDRGVNVSVVRAQNLDLYRGMYPQNSTDLQQKIAILDHLKSSIARAELRSGAHDRLKAVTTAEAKIRVQLQENVGAKLSLTPDDTASFSDGAPANMNRGMRDAFALALKLLKNNLVSCVNLGIGGFDTHSGQEVRLLPILSSFDFVLRTFVDGLRAAGQLDDTLIVCYSDFGRTPKVNTSNGRDHWPTGGALLIGGGIKGGRVIGGTNDRLLGESINPSTGAVDSAGTQLNPAHLGGAVLALTLGEDFVKKQRSYLDVLPGFTLLKG